ncbi:hypothetical protein SAMN06265338_102494 [Rhodoblastus acidophilus]|uniref:Uncharacterized protein n=1 Tax=Rhodoblastus acidophilus TaxID=1074 RepID=A0A212R3X9_RHOAC|nr:hypothetical protein [Rhodoblastus acidophilus]PPQ40237.1 hypothetical protein CKO16_00255 [Rhodoblastus acidophilus]RAI18151.1 hypothetical protein CH337_14765 [Rhodoblastus acidophilus]SNB66626.1 hypothetical protein SAMN06265338_102494 [Rhodoblastus acidophilus]
MDATELFRSCANEHVAAAALLCVGGGLVSRIDKAARPAGLTRGALVATLVADYERKASPELRRQLAYGMRRAEMPILAGLRHVLDVALNGALDLAPRRLRRPEWRAPPLTWAAEAGPFNTGEARHALHS